MLVQMVSVLVGKQYVEETVSLWSPDKVEVPRCSGVAGELTRNGLLPTDCWSNKPKSRLRVELPNSSSSLPDSGVAVVLSRIETPGDILKGLLMSSPTMGEWVDNEASMIARTKGGGKMTRKAIRNDRRKAVLKRKRTLYLKDERKGLKNGRMRTNLVKRNER